MIKIIQILIINLINIYINIGLLEIACKHTSNIVDDYVVLLYVLFSTGILAVLTVSNYVDTKHN